jgi:aspartokinase
MSITKQVEVYIKEHPDIRECLKKDLLNYSELSRQICNELKIKKFDAALIACRRYFWKIRKEERKEDVIKLVKTAKLMIKNKMIVAILDKPRDMDRIYQFQKNVKKRKGDFNIIEGHDVLTIITNSLFIDEIKELFSTWLIRITEKVVEIVLIFDKKIETTPGVVSYIYSLLSQNGINVLEEMSCWTDLMITIDEKDMAKAIKVLSF